MCISLCVYIYNVIITFPLLELCAWSVWILFSSFISLEVVQKTFGEVNETICNLLLCCFVFCFFLGGGGDSKPFEGNGDSERLWVGPLMGMAVIPPYMKLQNPSRDVTAQNSLVLICSCVFQDAGWLALGVMGQSSMLGWETL